MRSSPQQLQGLTVFAKSATKAKLEGLLQRYAEVLKNREAQKAAIEANGGQPVPQKKTKVMVPPALAKVLETGNLGESSQRTTHSPTALPPPRTQPQTNQHPAPSAQRPVLSAQFGPPLTARHHCRGTAEGRPDLFGDDEQRRGL